MKSIMMSIKPKWVAEILNGNKTIEVRKTMPADSELECVFLNGEPRGKMIVYIYCTKGKKISIPEKNYRYKYNIFEGFNKNDTPYKVTTGEDTFMLYPLNGKVVAEFICDLIKPFWHQGDYFNYKDQHWEKYTGMTLEEVDKYADGKDVYFYRITDLKIYDEPKPISDFGTHLDCYQEGDFDKLGCWECCEQFDNGQCTGNGFKPLTKAPQSWCYVEEL